MILQHHDLIAWEKMVHWIICFQMLMYSYNSLSKRSHALVSAPAKPENVLRIGKLSGSLVVDTGFLKFKLLSESLNFIKGSSVSWKWHGQFIHFWQKFCQSTQTVAQMLISQDSIVLWYAARVLYAFFPSYHTEYRRTYT